MASQNKVEQTAGFEALPGSCYCHSATYNLTAAPIFVNCCHCRNCQALTGSAFATNVVIETSNIELTSPANSISTTSSTNAEGEFSGTKTTCASCGTLLWASHPHFSEAISFLRAGTLSSAEQHIVPSAHFYTRSKHPWIQIPEDVASFETLPGPGVSLFGDEGGKRIEAAKASLGSKKV